MVCPARAGGRVPVGAPRGPTITVCRVWGTSPPFWAVLFSAGSCTTWWTVAEVPYSMPSPVAAEPLEAEVLRYSSTGYLVMDPAGRPLLYNHRAGDLGVLHAGIVDARIVAAAGRCAVSGERIEVDVEPVSNSASLTAPRTTPTVVAVVQLDRIRSHPRLRHRRIRRATDGSGTARFRRQCVARIEDAGGRHGPAGRSDGGCRRRSRTGPPVRREAAGGVGPVGRTGG